jgi:hypothetical protein
LTKEPAENLLRRIEQNQEAEKIRNRIARGRQMKKEVQFNLQLQLSAEIKEFKETITR